MATMYKTNTESATKNFPNEEPRKVLYGMTVTGNVRVWVKKFEKRNAYTVSAFRKNQNGEWDRCYMPIFFSGNCKPSDDLDEGGYDITIKDAFMTCSKKGDGFVPAIMVTDWE